MDLPTVLVTGFDPFAGNDINPSGELARRLGELGHPDCHLVADVLPVSFTRAPQLLAAAIDAHQPDILLMLGLAEHRHALTPERVALNLADADNPDNDGDQPAEAPLEPHGPAARFTTLPVKQIAHAIDAAGIPAHVSLTAGSYVCNAVLYTALGIAEQRGDHGKHAAAGPDGSEHHQPRLRAGFIHVPATPQLGGDPRFTLDELERGIRIALTTILGTPA
ncbi:MAG: pyroglutamyl-peptidase I [Microcella sp.]|uniref:pyroglutamyl-peptidase I family protein n=1 Tax=Microcella sp. TaxID=1913979 RepID=UPI0033160D84